jgi:hypothetical protein
VLPPATTASTLRRRRDAPADRADRPEIVEVEFGDASERGPSERGLGLADDFLEALGHGDTVQHRIVLRFETRGAVACRSIAIQSIVLPAESSVKRSAAIGGVCAMSR